MRRLLYLVPIALIVGCSKPAVEEPKKPVTGQLGGIPQHYTPDGKLVPPSLDLPPAPPDPKPQVPDSTPVKYAPNGTPYAPGIEPPTPPTVDPGATPFRHFSPMEPPIKD